MIPSGFKSFIPQTNFNKEEKDLSKARGKVLIETTLQSLHRRSNQDQIFSPIKKSAMILQPICSSWCCLSLDYAFE